MSLVLKVTLAVAAGLGLIAVTGGAWTVHEMTAGSGGAATTVSIVPGSSTQQIIATLDQKHVIKNSRLFRIYLRLKGDSGFEAGEYQFGKNLSFGDVVGVLKKGPKIALQRLTIPEGLTLKDIAARVGALPGRSATKFLEAAQSGVVHSTYQPAGSTNLEGLLFPDTYFVDAKEDETAILTRMVSEFDKVAGEVGLDQAAAKVGISPYEAVVVASLVESEGKVAADRPKIAEVIYNRLHKQIPLQIDATVIYARGGVHRENGQVLNSDLKVDSPYNTYKIKGLPPTPIAAAGRASLTAALGPESGPYLYYVKFQADGTHKFATTLDEQNRNVADARSRGVIP